MDDELRRLKRWQWKLRVLAFLAIACTAIAITLISRSVGARYTQPTATINYSPTKICDDAFTENLDHTNDAISYFDVKLREGCFGGFITVPKIWKGDWHTQPVGDATGYWEAVWPEGRSQGLGPYKANDPTTLNLSSSAHFRAQGHGTTRYYSNVVVPPRKVETVPAPIPQEIEK